MTASKIAAACAFLASLAVPAAALAQTVIHVKADATGSNDGGSWTNAFTDLQSGLAAAASFPGAQVWVATGTYRPGPAGNRAATFALPQDVALYGGFAGVETALDQRDVAANPTVLSGDIDQNDQTGGVPWYGAGYPGNSFHVVTASGVGATTVLDGFVVSGGSAVIGNPTPSGGAGLTLTNASPRIRGCTFRFNYGSFGGAIALTGGQPAIEDCRIESNLGWNGRGGGLSIGAGAGPSIRRCMFRGNVNMTNSIDPAGGAIYVDFGAPAQTIEDCAFESNQAITQTGFGNFPGRGGAIFNPIEGMVVRRCTFVRNQSHVGGAIESFRGITIESCLFDANSVTTIATSSGSVGGIGGAVDVLGLVGAPHATIAGCTVVRNTASDECGGIFINGTATAAVHSCIFRQNSDGNGMVGQSQLKGEGAASSCIQNFMVPVPGEDPIDPSKYPGCIDADPQFVDADGNDGIPGNADDDLRLKATSPCVDAGLVAWTPSGLDAGRSPRRLDGNLDGAMRADMGAHEFDHVALAVTTASQPSGKVVTIDITGTAGLLSVLVIGVPGAETVVAPYGPLFFQFAVPVVLAVTGPVPVHLVGFTPPLGGTLQFQAAALGGVSGNLSNPVAVEL